MLDNPFLIIGGLVAVIVVLVVVMMTSSKKEKKAQKTHHQERTNTSSSESVSAAATQSAPSTAAVAERKRPKKKNRSSKSKAAKARAREEAAAAAATVAGSTSSPVPPSETEESPNDGDSDTDSSDDDDTVPSGIRFQLATHKKTAAKPQAKKEKKVAIAAPAAAPATTSAVTPAAAPTPTPAPAPKAAAPRVAVEEVEGREDGGAGSPTPQYDGWAVVEDKRKKTGKKGSEEGLDSPPASSAPNPISAPEPTPAPAAASAPAAPQEETVTMEVTVDAKKVGGIIGPKGATKIAIQTLTGANISIPRQAEKAEGKEAAASSAPVTLTITGVAQGVSRAAHAINELITKGYSLLLEGDDFSESYVSVLPRFLPDIIGKAGNTIRLLQQHTGVRITVPQTPKAEAAAKVTKVKVGLAGKKAGVSQARTLIKDLCRLHYTPVTHPGLTHVELELDAKYFNFIIGAKGSEIKNIQNSHKVQVHIPQGEGANPNVVIVGKEEGVEAAKRHIEKIVERVDNAAAAKEAAEKKEFEAGAASHASATASSPPADATASKSAAAPSAIPSVASWGNSKSRLPPAPKVEEEPLVDESWMNEFNPPTGGMDLSAMLPATAKFSAAPAPVVAPAPAAPAPVIGAGEKKAPPLSSAWNNLSSLPADKW
eukprot:gene36957-44834_t